MENFFREKYALLRILKIPNKYYIGGGVKYIFFGDVEMGLEKKPARKAI